LKNADRQSLRVGLIVSQRSVSEYPLSLERLLVGLADESIPVALVCPPGCDIGSMTLGAADVIRHPPIDLPLAERLGRRALAERLVEFKPTVLHCLCEGKASLAKRLAHRMDLPYVLTVNSLQRRWGLSSVSARHCAKIIVPAPSIAANIAKVYPHFADRIEQINIGTFVAEGSACFSELARIATIVLAHPLDNADDFENLFSAVRHMILDGYEFMMLVMGGGRAESQVRRLLAALDLLRTVTVVPRLRPWRSVLAAGDIFIQPVVSSAFNPFLLEAMSVGAAVAACRGGVDDLIIEDKTAVVFDPNDELSIIRTLQRLLDRRELARKIAKAAQEYLRENHSVSKMISATLRTYHNALQWYEPSNP